jgi:hypothetical protein
MLALPRLAAAPFLDARRAAAAAFEKKIKIFLAVIESNLLARRDGALGHQHHLLFASAPHRLGIGPARMVGVAAEIAPRRAIDGPFAVDSEQVARAPALQPIGFVVADPRAGIGDDVFPSFGRPHCEQAEAGQRPADAEGACGHGLWRIIQTIDET